MERKRGFEPATLTLARCLSSSTVSCRVLRAGLASTEPPPNPSEFNPVVERSTTRSTHSNGKPAHVAQAVWESFGPAGGSEGSNRVVARCSDGAASKQPFWGGGHSAEMTLLAGTPVDYVVRAKIWPRTNSMMSPSLRLAPRRTAEAKAAPPRRLRRSSASEPIRSASITRNGNA
jgi:hypothetical protein